MTAQTTTAAQPRRIHTDHNGVYVTACTTDHNGADVEGHKYTVEAGPKISVLDFQLGPVLVAGINGLTTESVLAILIDRTKFLDGRFGSDENKRAIQHMEEALLALEARSARRLQQGIEGRDMADVPNGTV